MRDSVGLLHRLRGEIDVVGYFWWPFVDQVRREYRESVDAIQANLHRLGLVELVPGDVGQLERRPTEALDAYRELATHHVDHRGASRHS